MINFFDRLYALPDTYLVFKKLKLYSIRRFLIRLTTNLVVPAWYKLSNIFFKDSLGRSSIFKDKKVIVSLTSFPRRIGKVWIVVECLLRQKVKPDKIILWLSSEQFGSINELPQSLLAYQKRGLEVRLCDGDLRSHKKYFYAFQEYDKDINITVDDDLFYSTSLIGDLIALYNRYPTCISCHRALEIKKLANKTVAPYKTWSLLKSETEPSFKIFQTSGGGTLYPPGALLRETFNVEVFKKYCFYADDVWLNIMACLSGTKTVKSSYFTNYIPIYIDSNINLSSKNVGENLNDRQIADTRKYYQIALGIDPFLLAITN